MPDRALRMGNTNGLSRGSRGTAPISRPWELARSRRPVARPLSPARLSRCNLNSNIRRMEHQEYPQGEASMLRQRSLCIFMQPHATKKGFCSIACFIMRFESPLLRGLIFFYLVFLALASSLVYIFIRGEMRPNQAGVGSKRKVVKGMEITLGFLALSIFLLYSVYFIKIIKGNPESFELDLLNSLANWMIEKGAKSQVRIWMMLLLSLLLEASYFLLVILIVANPVMLGFTVLFATFELLHLLVLGLAFKRFFQGQKVLKEVFNWKMERSSALLFFTYSLLVLINLWWI